MSVFRGKLTRWGHSYAVRIPKAAMEAAGLRAGSEVELHARSGRIRIVAVGPKLTLESLLSQIRPDNLHREHDWGKPAGNES